MLSAAKRFASLEDYIRDQYFDPGTEFQMVVRGRISDLHGIDIAIVDIQPVEQAKITSPELTEDNDASDRSTT